MTDPTPQSDLPDLPDTLPPRILAALQQAERIDDLPTDELDSAVLEASREHFAEINRQRRLRRFFALGGAGAALATAAAVAIVALVGNPFGISSYENMASNMQSEADSAPQAPLTQSLPHDFNGDGKTDVGDSLYLAQALNRGETGDRYDLTGDGQLTQTDIDQLQQRIVSLHLTVTQRSDGIWYAIAEPNPEPTSGGGS